MFEARVAQFYRAKGYEVHENPKVRGSSENVYSVALVADGPLGALLISFGDAGGVDAAELGRVRTMARDIGATPVVAAPTLSPDLRRLAAQMGVVVVDDSLVGETGPLPTELPRVDGRTDLLRRDIDAHPWPASGRAFSLANLPAAAGARDVDELIADLHKPIVKAVPAPPPLVTRPTTPPQVSQAQVLEPPAAAPAPVPAVQGTKFAWLNGGALVQTQVGQEVSLSDVFGAKSKPSPAAAVPAVEQEAVLQSRQPFLERARMTGWSAWDSVRDWPWRTIVWTAAGAGVLVALIRWFAGP